MVLGNKDPVTLVEGSLCSSVILQVDPTPNSQRNIIRIVQQTAKRISNEILAVQGLKYHTVNQDLEKV